ncbi:LysR family transcriptional regulator [Jannaschia aquimarina]|uniref:DmlR_8 protein n=1 Tax=Jannaschia aquimarina TaxID=935700 RepID=A0A0D1EB69_9RHOB|nr:LysR family transcriptional regulator [Jannaschia aquimarina]KIT14186.1 HTH-type transcriptional regulator DmlR [Jannaschia aquimarina]SNS47636.1 DNA-binding transcriptional regulator, LysR family [Jannaschia aquimarina]
MYEWSDIRTFLAVMRLGSAAAAARELGTNQTTVGRRIERLEAALSLRLFERGARGTEPTSNAHALMPEAEAMEAAALALDSHARGMRRHLSGVIRLTTVPGAARYISGLLRAFRAEHPDVRFELDADDRALSLEMGEADVAMRAAERLTGDTLVARKLFDHPWALYASEDYVQRHGKPASLGDLKDHRTVLYAKLVGERVDCVGQVQDMMSGDEGPLRVSSVEAMTGLLLDGEGVGLLPRASGDVEPGLHLCITEPWIYQRFWLVWSPQGDATPHVHAFIRFALDRFPGFLKALPKEWSA